MNSCSERLKLILKNSLSERNVSFLDWLRRFMMGRYGPDQLGFALMIIYLILIFLSPLTGFWLLRLVALALLAWCFFRMLSRNTSKRYAENLKFLALWNPIKSQFQKFQARFKDSKTHRYYKCPNCKSTLRVPRGRGKIQITCPVCHTEFIKKT